MKEYPCIESTLEYSVNGLIVRVWRDHDTLEEAESHKGEDILELVRSRSWGVAELTRAINELPRVNATHVTSTPPLPFFPKHGVVGYVNWP